MTNEAYIAIIAVVGGILCNAVVCAFFYGKLTSRVASNEENCDKHTGQIKDIIETLHSYPHGHGVRLTRLETRKDDEDERNREKH